MKNIIKYTLALCCSTVLFGSAFGQGRDMTYVNAMLKDSLIQKEILTIIQNDGELLNKVVSEFIQDDQVMQVILRELMVVAATDEQACNDVASVMMSNSHLLTMMKDLMHSKGMIQVVGEEPGRMHKQMHTQMGMAH